MEWSNHPSYQRARERLVKCFRARVYGFKHLRPVVFLCGGYQSPRRDTLAAYIRRQHPELLVFYADSVWEHVKELEHISALEMEAQLARFADVLVIIVESAGTIAELGAFANSEELRPKLLPILESRFEKDASFINTGPVSWVNRDSKYGPTIYCDFDPILLAAGTIGDRLKRIPDRGRLPSIVKSDEVATRPKHLLLLLADVVAVTGPVTGSECGAIVETILRHKPVWSVHSLLGLAVEFGLVHAFQDGSRRYYFRPLNGGRLESLQKHNRIDIASQRAQFLCVLQKLPGGRELLAKTWVPAC